MADQEQLRIMKQGTVAWNIWREKHREVQIDLRGTTLSNANLKGVHLSDADLSNVNLSNVNLSYANLSGADLSYAKLKEANLKSANLSNAILSSTDFSYAKLNDANFSGSDCFGANLSHTDLSGANSHKAHIWNTILGNIDLRHVKGLETVRHGGPSTIGMDTLMRSEGDIPASFLKGAGISDGLIEYARSLIGQAIEYYTCFISYSSQDEAFAKRMYADLQSQNVRCWFAPEDMKVGDKIRHRIDESIRLYDKLLLVLSEHSIGSEWVEHEVEMALAKERDKKQTVLFPVRLDKAIIEMNQDGWPSEVRHTRHIGNFERWKDHDKYQKSFQRLLRDLQAKDKPGSE